MARIRRCHQCSTENPVHELYCVNCGIDMEGVETETTDRQHAAEPPPLETPSDNPLAAFMTESAPTQFRLVFPWGEWVMRDRVVVGRDYRVSPFGMQLKDYNLVSGVHAEIWVEAGVLHLRHVGRYPIQVNDDFIHNGESRELKPGDILDFANQLVLRVKT